MSSGKLCTHHEDSVNLHLVHKEKFYYAPCLHISNLKQTYSSEHILILIGVQLDVHIKYMNSKNGFISKYQSVICQNKVI